MSDLWYRSIIEDALKDPKAILLTILVGLIVYITGSSLIKRRKYPPGPWGLPIIGYAPFMTKTPHVKLSKLSEKYGDVIMIRIMGDPIVHLNSYEVTREAFVEKGYDFGGKPQDFSFFQWITDSLGIAQSEGPIWKEHRRFALHTLRDFGFGKLALERKVLDIVGDLVKTLELSKGQPIDINEDISNCANNTICSLLFNKHYGRNDPEFLETRAAVNEVFGLLQGASAFLATPLSKFLPIHMLPNYDKFTGIKKHIQSIFTRHIKEHEDTYDPNNMRDYLDAFLDERKRQETEKVEDTTFTIDRLIAIGMNFFFAGTETITATMYWAYKIMMIHQDVQKKVQEEIDRVIGREREPSIIDRPKMPYTEAVIAEIHRFATIVAIIPVHSNPEEATLAGYTIPKRSIIMANLWRIHRDPRYYSDPEKFIPERFLEADGSLKKMDHLIPFSMGKRACPGEALARMEVFLFLTSVLQRFNLTQPEGHNDNTFECHKAVIRRLTSYKLSAKCRY